MMTYLVSCQDIDMEIETFFGRRHKFAGSLENEEEYLLRAVCGHYVVQRDDGLLVADERSVLQLHHGAPPLAPAVLVTHGRGS